eukprot:TRINITY_DN11632_c0_g2_i2.p1 TRINITY_DN11632_c0_g2~~TRINITY_DN11632_c0_g2_i2.p1  ORF type:complete len:566 (+),score=72.61 TRINITY_DN11632_c0_g2_i2:80-1777(+)
MGCSGGRDARRPDRDDTDAEPPRSPSAPSVDSSHDQTGVMAAVVGGALAVLSALAALATAAATRHQPPEHFAAAPRITRRLSAALREEEDCGRGKVAESEASGRATVRLLKSQARTGPFVEGCSVVAKRTVLIGGSTVAKIGEEGKVHARREGIQGVPVTFANHPKAVVGVPPRSLTLKWELDAEAQRTGQVADTPAADVPSAAVRAGRGAAQPKQENKAQGGKGVGLQVADCISDGAMRDEEGHPWVQAGRHRAKNKKRDEAVAHEAAAQKRTAPKQGQHVTKNKADEEAPGAAMRVTRGDLIRHVKRFLEDEQASEICCPHVPDGWNGDVCSLAVPTMVRMIEDVQPELLPPGVHVEGYTATQGPRGSTSGGPAKGPPAVAQARVTDGSSRPRAVGADALDQPRDRGCGAPVVGRVPDASNKQCPPYVSTSASGQVPSEVSRPAHERGQSTNRTAARPPLHPHTVSGARLRPAEEGAGPPPLGDYKDCDSEVTWWLISTDILEFAPQGHPFVRGLYDSGVRSVAALRKLSETEHKMTAVPGMGIGWKLRIKRALRTGNANVPA